MLARLKGGPRFQRFICRAFLQLFGICARHVKAVCWVWSCKKALSETQYCPVRRLVGKNLFHFAFSGLACVQAHTGKPLPFYKVRYSDLH